jgi:hypothetical protein
MPQSSAPLAQSGSLTAQVLSLGLLVLLRRLGRWRAGLVELLLAELALMQVVEEIKVIVEEVWRDWSTESLWMECTSAYRSA